MSHFAVMVVGPNIEEQLAPYHEFECTGRDDQYVQDIDKTEEARAEWLKSTSRRLKTPTGELESPYTEEGDYRVEFYRDPTPEEIAEHGPMHGSGGSRKISYTSKDWGDGKGYRAKVFELPEGWSEVWVPTPEVETFANWASDYYGAPIVRPTSIIINPNHDKETKYGYTLVDEAGEMIKLIDRTNPNKKWDWYQVGGRMTGHFKLKPQAIGVLGTPGLQRINKDYAPPTDDRADVAMKGSIDFDFMRNEAGAEAEALYTRIMGLWEGLLEYETWDSILDRHGVDKENLGAGEEDENGKTPFERARDEYRAQPRVEALSGADLWHYDANDFLISKEEYVANARNEAIMTYAVCSAGEWYERGQMGWFGCASNELSRSEWAVKFNEFIDALPDDTILSIVDCHI